MNTHLLQSAPYAAKLQQSLKELFAINSNSVSDPATLWAAHKAYTRGRFIQLGSKAKRERQRHIEILTSDIQNKNLLNKSNPHPLKTKLGQLRLELRTLLLDLKNTKSA